MRIVLCGEASLELATFIRWSALDHSGLLTPSDLLKMLEKSDPINDRLSRMVEAVLDSCYRSTGAVQSIR